MEVHVRVPLEKEVPLTLVIEEQKALEEKPEFPELTEVWHCFNECAVYCVKMLNLLFHLFVTFLVFLLFKKEKNIEVKVTKWFICFFCVNPFLLMLSAQYCVKLRLARK